MPSQFAQSIAPDVVNSCVNTGVFPSVVIAQAIEESGSGSSKLARLYNNLFGHAASSTWLGKKAQTVAGGRFWRVYDTISQSIAAHIGILSKPAYKLAGVLTAKTPFEQATDLQSVGYDSGPDKTQYAQKLAHLIASQGLQQYDQAMFNIERQKNKNGLAYHEQAPLTKTLHQIFG